MSADVTINGEPLFESDYIGGVDLKGREVTVEIATVSKAKVRQKNGEPKDKGILSFKGAKKKLILNKTNALIIASLYGGKMEGWVGKRIILYPQKETCFGQLKECLRIRPEVPGKPRPDPAPSFDDIPSGIPTEFHADAPEELVNG